MQGVKEKALGAAPDTGNGAVGVLGWKTGEFFYDLTPGGVSQRAEEIERDFVWGAFCGANFSKYLIAGARKDGKVTAFLAV